MEEPYCGFLSNGFSTKPNLFKPKTRRKIDLTTNNQPIGSQVSVATHVNQIRKPATPSVNKLHKVGNMISVKRKSPEDSTARIPMLGLPIVSSCPRSKNYKTGHKGRPVKSPHATYKKSSKNMVENGLLQNSFVSSLSRNQDKLSPIISKRHSHRRMPQSSPKTLSSQAAPTRNKVKRTIHKTGQKKSTTNNLVSEDKNFMMSLRKKLSMGPAKQLKNNLEMQENISKISNSSRKIMAEPLTPAATPIHTPGTAIPSFLSDQAYPIKCPPFCAKGCSSEHSKLLLALLNCDDNSDNFKDSLSFRNFLNVVDYYKKKNWKINSSINDVNPEYQYPLLHWAAILSKLNMLKWMASAGYNINVLHINTGDTALHRVLLCIKAIRLNNPVTLKTFPLILDILEPNLKIRNKSGLTPFLSCCETVSMDGRSHSRNVELLKEIINFSRPRRGLLNILFNQLTKEGQSALHLLALNDNALRALKILVVAGANIQCLDKQGRTPFSLAVSLGQLRIAQYLEKQPLNITPPCIDTPLSSAPSSRASSSNSPSESNGDNMNLHEATDIDPNAVGPTASDTDSSTPPLSKRIKVESSLPSDYESDVSENTFYYTSSRNYPSKVKHVYSNCSNNGSDGILKQYFYICNDKARENLISSINTDKDQCLQELKVTEERLAGLSRHIESICKEKHKKETEMRRLKMEMEVFDQNLEELKEEKQDLTEKSSSLDAKISLCVSVLKIVHNTNT
ncbi:uncharacterized protein LOC115214145 isoform X1 [Argonauta hians]